MKCPKCRYERTPEDDKVTQQTECPACGIIYTRYIQLIEKKRKTAEAAKKAAKTRTLKGRIGQIYLNENGVELTKNGNEEPRRFTFSQIKDIQFEKCSGAISGFLRIQDIDTPAYKGGVFKATYDDNAIVFGTANPKALFSSSICDEINKEWSELRNSILVKIGKKPIEFADKDTASDRDEKAKFNYKYAGIAALLIFIAVVFISIREKNSASYRIARSTPSITDKKETIPVSSSSYDPKCTEGKKWKYVINNAYRTADEYATSRNPSSTFISVQRNYQFIEQFGGEFQGKHLLMITNEHGGNVSFAILLPMFDVNMSSEGLNDEGYLWRVVSAKLNGRSY